MIERLTRSSTLTPNLKRLLAEFVARATMEKAGSDVGAVSMHILNGGLAESARQGFEDMATAIYALRSAPDAGDWNDEEAAGLILKHLEAFRSPALACGGPVPQGRPYVVGE